MRDSNYLAAHNARHTFHPMGHPAEIQAHPPRIIASGSGVRVTDSNGFEVVDAVGGLWNVNLGYSCDPIKQAIADQLAALPYYAAFRGTTTPSLIELSERLTTILEPEGMTRAFFTSGGSDSIESALRIARQYWKATGARDRFKFLSFKKGYHGTHFGGASVNGGIRFRRNYEPMLPGCFHVPFPETYRNSFGTSRRGRIDADLPEPDRGRDYIPGSGHHCRVYCRAGLGSGRCFRAASEPMAGPQGALR